MNIFVSILLWITYLVSLYFAIFWFLVFLDDMPGFKKKRLKQLPRVSVVIPAYNEEKSVGSTILSVLKLDYPKEVLEVIVVNDGSKDKTRKIVENIISKNTDFDIKLINQKNKGKGAALNAGLKACKGDYFVCLDADSYVKPNTLKKMLVYFTKRNIAAVLPTLKVHEPTNAIEKIQWYEYLVNMFYKELMSKLNCVHVAPGPFSVYRKDVLEKVGGFDEDNNLTEDLEITLRLQSQNYELIQLLDTNVYTSVPSNIKDLYRQRNRWYKGAIMNAVKYKNMMFNKKYGDFGIIQMPTIIVSGVIAFIMICSILYYTFKPYVEYLYHLSYVNFDILLFLRTLTFNFNILDIDYTLLLVAAIMLIITAMILRKSHTCTKEKLLKFGFLSLTYYVFLYFLVLGVMWIGITFDLLLRRKQKW